MSSSFCSFLACECLYDLLSIEQYSLYHMFENI